MATSSATKISQLYVSLFGRAPDSAGLAFWTEALDGGSWTFASIAKSMFDTAPARAYYPAGATAEAVVTTFYTNVLGRAPDAEGLAFWVKEYTAAGKDQGAFFAKLITNVVDYTGTDAAGLKSKNLFANKVTVAEFYGNNGGSIAGATAALTGVTEVASTVDTAKTAILNPVVAGQTFTLTTGTDTLVGTAGNDTFTGLDTASTTTDTYSDSDAVVDASTKDADVYNLTLAASSTPVASNVETINVTTSSTSAVTVTASSISGAKLLKVTPTSVTVADTTLAGDKTVTVASLNATKVLAVEIGSGTSGTATVNQATKAGVTVNADVATGSVTVLGAATVNASGTGSTKTVTVTPLAGTTAAVGTENAKPVTVNTSAGTISIATDGTDNNEFTGAITINAPKTKAVTVNNSEGGVNVTAGVTSTADTTITVKNITSAGATIVTGTGIEQVDVAVKEITVSLDGTDATTDAASVSGAGFIKLDQDLTDLVENITLSGSTADVEYQLQGASVANYTLTGANSVKLSGDAALFTGGKVVDSTTAGKTTVELTTLGASADLSGVAADEILVAATGSARTLTLATGAQVKLAADQTTSIAVAGKKPGATINLATGDDTDASGDVIDITTGTLTASSNITTLNVDASVGSLTLTTATTLATTATINVTGTEDVALGTLTAKKLDASASTGSVSVTSGNVSLVTITTGSGDDSVTSNRANVITVATGSGDDEISVGASTLATSSVSAGDGDDAITLTSTAATVISAGSGDDTVTIAGANSDSILALGAGTDTVVFDAAQDNSSATTYANFSLLDVEVVDITGIAGTVVINTTAFAKDNTFKIEGTTTADIFKVKNVSSTAGATIDASGITFDTEQSASLYLEGGAGTDTITGSSKVDTIIASAGGDSVNGGTGSDNYVATALDAVKEVTTQTNESTGVVINLGSTAITNTTISLSGVGVTADTVTSVAAGKVAYLYAEAEATNSAVLSTLTSIENVTGSAGDDYIVGSASANVITASAGTDYADAGLGDDTFSFTGTLLAAQSTALSTFKGNTGTDKILLTSATTAVDDADFENFTSVETLQLANGTNTIVLGANAVTAGIVSVVGGTGADTVTLHSDVTSYTGGGGADVITLLASYDGGLTLTNSADSTLTISSGALGAATRFDAAAEASLAAVDIAGEWFLNSTTKVLTYWDDNAGAVATVTLTGIQSVSTAAGTSNFVLDFTA